MKIETIRGRHLSEVARSVEQTLGRDAMVLRTRMVPGRFGSEVEIVACAGSEVRRVRKLLEPAPLPPVDTSESSGARPAIIALVGPTGAGKTTTLAKLALHPELLAGRNAFLSLDTFRTGALEQLESYADLAGTPLEVVYTREEIEGALERLAGCDRILIDSPGLAPRDPERNRLWMELLALLAPDEVHLVLPAALRVEVARSMLHAYRSVGCTHLLLTKLDEVEDDAGVADLAVQLKLPARWLTDGQEIPDDLHLAPKRVLASLAHYSGGPSTRSAA